MTATGRRCVAFPRGYSQRVHWQNNNDGKLWTDYAFAIQVVFASWTKTSVSSKDLTASFSATTQLLITTNIRLDHFSTFSTSLWNDLIEFWRNPLKWFSRMFVVISRWVVALKPAVRYLEDALVEVHFCTAISYKYQSQVFKIMRKCTLLQYKQPDAEIAVFFPLGSWPQITSNHIRNPLTNISGQILSDVRKPGTRLKADDWSSAPVRTIVSHHSNYRIMPSTGKLSEN